VRTDPVADREDHIEVVMVDEPGNLSRSLGLNYSELPNRCPGIELGLVEEMLPRCSLIVGTETW